jgi:hypothetical protein
MMPGEIVMDSSLLQDHLLNAMPEPSGRPELCRCYVSDVEPLIELLDSFCAFLGLYCKCPSWLGDAISVGL